MRVFSIGLKSPETAAGRYPADKAYPLALDYDRVKRTVVLYSNYRCGTNFVKSNMARMRAVHVVDELFAREATNGRFAFARYVENEAPDTRELLLDPENGLRRYLNYVYAGTPDSGNILFDVKYEQAYRLGVDGQDQTPIILTQFMHASVPIIHLIRKDVIAQAISHLVATRTGVYMALRGRGAEDPDANAEQYWFDPEEVVRLARGRVYAHEQARTQLGILGGRTLTVFYEDLIGPNWREQFLRIFRFLDVYVEIPADFTPATASQQSASRVSNRGEILDYVQERAPELIHTYAM